MTLEELTELGERMRKVRELRKWSQGELADALGVSRPTVSLYEAGKSEPKWSIIRRVVELLGIQFSTFTRSEVDWHEVERAILEKQIRDLHERPYRPNIDLGKDNVKDNAASLVAVMAL